MTTHDARTDANGFVRFFRNYTKTWVHAVATAGLTAFGTLTIVHRGFIVLALASYLVPPVVLYLRRGQARPEDVDDSHGSDATESATAADTGSIPEGGEPIAGERDRADSSDRSAATATPDASTNATPGEAAATDAAGEATGTESRATVDHRRDERANSGRTLEGAEPEANDADESEATDRTRDGASDDGAATAASTAETRSEWQSADAPTDATLRDVTVAGSNGGYAVGDGGIVLAGDDRETSDDHTGWSVVLEDGPAAGGNDLRGTDSTADGEVVWVAGDSGALGRIDAETGRHTDYTAPEDITDNWLGVAVGGASGEETVLLINGSGAVLRGAYRESSLEWTGPDKPGSGSSLSGVALADDGVGYCCDTNDGVFETTDGGETFERVGLEGADGTLTDVATAGRGDCLVSADDGVVHRYDDGTTWTPERVADDSLAGIDRLEERTVACAADGAVHERRGPTADWERLDTDAAGALLAVSLGSARSVAVGEDGTIVERR